MSSIEERIENIEKNIEDMNEKLNRILEILNKDLTGDCKKMAKHIDFVEGVYENVKHPLNYICSKVTPLLSSSDTEPRRIDSNRRYEIGPIESELDEFDHDGFLDDSDEG